jgi:hypothetical protein
MNKIYCPNCYCGYDKQPDNCSCGYPFTGNEMDKYKFMSHKIKKVQAVQEGIKSADYARYVLFIIGGLNLLISIIYLMMGGENSTQYVTMTYSLLLIVLGFFSYKEPFYSLLFGLIVLIGIYLIMGLADPKIFFSGLITRAIFTLGFIYGLIKVKRAENILNTKSDNQK